MKSTAKISDSLEDYLEAILVIVKKKPAARAKDIVKQLQVKASSVTGALKLLSEKGFINYAPYDLITLTPEGERIARDVDQRHKALHDFFTKVLCVEEKEADDSACKLEHAISPSILKRLNYFVDFLDQCPRSDIKWNRELNSFCCNGRIGKNCAECIKTCLKKLPE